MLRINMDSVESLIAEVAEQVIVPRFGALKMEDIRFKSGDDPVTIADKEAESELIKRLLDLLPGSKAVGEETFASDSSVLDLFLGEDPIWIVDPLDGTKAFVASDPVYGVIVALAKQNQTIAGWLYDPTSKECVCAEKGAGAYYKGRRLSVLPSTQIGDMRGILGARIRCAFEDSDLPVGGPHPSYCRMLSACHDYASLVVGTPHFARRYPSQMHFHGTQRTCTPWDMAAGVLIHAEAGGHSAHWNGDAFHPSAYGRGIFSAPDKESWLQLREWVRSFCPLPE